MLPTNVSAAEPDMLGGMDLLNAVSERIVVRWLETRGASDLARTNGTGFGGPHVDLTCLCEGIRQRIKVKADPYFGIDETKINDRSLLYYRRYEACFALEAIANAATREPGWMFDSQMTDVYYHYLCIAQPEEEVRALYEEPDDIFFTELEVDRDELVVMPMDVARPWFEESFERYSTRPVMLGGASAWYRVVPRAELERAVPQVRSVGSIFSVVKARY